MVSSRKSSANARNAARSTGPLTAGGKSRSSLNAVAHGLRAVSPVLPGEDASQWEAYRAAVVAELRACGTLEAEVAGRVAAVSWRLRRVVAFEVAAATTPPPPPMDPQTMSDLFGRVTHKPRTLEVVANALASAEAYLAVLRRLAALLARLRDGGPFSGAEALFLLRESAKALPDTEDDEGDEDATPDVDGEEFQAAVGVPESYREDPEGWGGWAAAAVRVGLTLLADSAGWTPERLVAGAARHAVEGADEGKRRIATLRPELAALELAAAQSEVRARQFRAVPAEHILNAVTRYEPYLARQLSDAIDLLERVQSARHAAEAVDGSK